MTALLVLQPGATDTVKRAIARVVGTEWQKVSGTPARRTDGEGSFGQAGKFKHASSHRIRCAAPRRRRFLIPGAL